MSNSEDLSLFTPSGWHTITPRITVKDAAGLVKFMNHVFETDAKYSDDVPTNVKIGDSILMISEAVTRDKATAFLYIYVRDVDEVYKRALEAGAESIEDPRDLPYGDRRAMVKDNWGNSWQIATYGVGKSSLT
jgi:uncharacterized glyoxalase superfamily protein PhnB